MPHQHKAFATAALQVTWPQSAIIWWKLSSTWWGNLQIYRASTSLYMLLWCHSGLTPYACCKGLSVRMLYVLTCQICMRFEQYLALTAVNRRMFSQQWIWQLTSHSMLLGTKCFVWFFSHANQCINPLTYWWTNICTLVLSDWKKVKSSLLEPKSRATAQAKVLKCYWLPI